ncbi:hypothetical protein DQ384_01450 [Sphaerisporangium album]|uniref:Uncharacterized protein n=1 Tax=Sphaerisporangium album TaxID=509200 RepID=A0A367FRS9_9ACTN|nr:hypothetical protein [Sphaerisporangium album]RCG33133.1 hypothetical protein DQ384_01450 [Sphaerisporangium album]
MTTRPSRATTFAAPAALAFASLLNHLLWLGWHRPKILQPDGGQTGPYEPWQIAGLVIVLAALGVAAGLSRRPVLSTVVVAGVTWLAWTADAATSDDSGLWAVGALLMLPALFLGVGLVAWATAKVRARRPGERT